MEFTKPEHDASTTGLSEDEYASAAKLREAVRLFFRESERITRAWDLTGQRYDMLLMIRTARGGSGRATLHELMERLQLAQSSVVELVDRAQALGLVERARGPAGSGRAVLVSLTEEGARRLEGAATELVRHRRRLAGLLAGLEQ